MKLSFVSFLFLACGQIPTATYQRPDNKTSADIQAAKELATDEQRRDLRETPSMPLVSETSLPIDVESYHLTGNFDWTRQVLMAQVAIKLNVLGQPTNGTTISLDAGMDKIISVQDKVTGPLNFEVRRDINKLIIPATTQALDLVIVYEAKESNSLRAIEPRDGDPVQSDIVYTASEPLGTANWMPCNNVPSDRALFAITMNSPANQQLVANGALKQNTVNTAGTRQSTWSTRESLPTYLMAFALGQFQFSEIYAAGVPVSVWARQGVKLDSTGLLSMLKFQMEKFANLVGPYPFEKYAVVLLPDFPAGGIENTSVTFQRETGSTEARLTGDFGLYAHELAHQWFGDYATVETWDDLWIKEGMATLMAAEAERGWDDFSDLSHLGAGQFRVEDGEAIRDTAIPAEGKYNSGPYGRSAWFFTQLRAAAGEEQFWSTMRKLLAENAFGTLNQDKVVDLFAPVQGMNKETLLAALAAKKLPVITFTESNAITKISLIDADSAMVMPMQFTLRDTTQASVRSVNLKSDTPIESSGEWIIPDTRNIHLSLDQLSDQDVFKLPSAFFPKSGAELEEFNALSATTQDFTIRNGMSLSLENWNSIMPAGDIAAFAKALAMCKSSELDIKFGAAKEAEVLDFRGFGRRGAGFVDCADQIRPQAQALANRLLLDPALDGVSDTEMTKLSLYFFDTEIFFPLWSKIFEQGATLRSREIAGNTLTKLLSEKSLKPYAPRDLSAWFALIENQLRQVNASELSRPLTGMITRLGGQDLTGQTPVFVRSLSSVFAKPQSDALSKTIICLAWNLGKTTDGAGSWVEFKQAGMNSKHLTNTGKSLIAGPAICDVR